MTITAGGVTHPGHVRPINEDAFLSDPENGFFIVADGMGGHNAGEVASRLVIEAIRTFLSRTRAGDDVTWPYGIDPRLSFDSNRMLTAIRLANRRVFRAGESREDYTGMGSTVVATLVHGDRLSFASVGDSRLYSFSGGSLVQLTEDDTWVAMTGAFDSNTATTHPMRHVLTNVVGARDQIDCHVSERVLAGDETFLLSTDGLHGALAPAILESILCADNSPQAIADRLLEAALEHGGGDNITAVVVRCQR